MSCVFILRLGKPARSARCQIRSSYLRSSSVQSGGYEIRLERLGESAQMREKIPVCSRWQSQRRTEPTENGRGPEARELSGDVMNDSYA